MSLTGQDLLDIRSILSDELKKELKPISGELEALSNDIKEIYEMISELQHSVITDKDFKKLSTEKQLLTLNAELLNLAKQAGVNLPR